MISRDHGAEKIYYGDHSHSFGRGNFKYETTAEAIEYMLYIKDLFKYSYEIENIKYIDRYIWDHNLNEIEISLLYELLDYTEQ